MQQQIQLQPRAIWSIYNLDSKSLNFYDADVSRRETLEILDSADGKPQHGTPFAYRERQPFAPRVTSSEAKIKKRVQEAGCNGKDYWQ